MKKFIPIALCFIMAASVLTGCGRKKNHQTTDTTTTTTTLTTHTTMNTDPSIDTTVPTSSSVTQDEAGVASTPGIGNDNMDSNPAAGRSRYHGTLPHINGSHR